MFLCLGIEQAQKMLRDFRNIICPACGRYSYAQLIITYTFLHIFFIPTFKWNKKYYIKTGCCGAIYECDEKTAMEFKNTGKVDFSKVKQQAFYENENICRNCGAYIEKGYSYCPFCGNKL